MMEKRFWISCTDCDAFYTIQSSIIPTECKKCQSHFIDVSEEDADDTSTTNTRVYRS